MRDTLVHIGEVIVNGVIFDPKNGEQLRNMDPNALLKSVPELFDLLDERGVEYALVAGIAMLVYVECRNTQYIDLIVASESLKKLPEINVEDQNRDFARTKFGDLQIDFLFTHNKLFEKVRTEHTIVKQFAEREIRCATVEAIILLKLFALPSMYRQGRFEKVDIYQSDILRLIREFEVQTEALLAELSQHMLPTDVDELRSIVAKIESEISESRDRFSEDC